MDNYPPTDGIFDSGVPTTNYGDGQDKGQNYMLQGSNFYGQTVNPFDKTYMGTSQSNHINESKKHTVVWTHWMKGLCKKGEHWEFLHTFDPTKMPICKYYQSGNCKNDNCQYLHRDPRIKMNDCPYYERGFCKNGLNCKNAHSEKQICEDYLYGFCIRGPNCIKIHLRSLVSIDDDNLEILANFGVANIHTAPDTKAICHRCGNRGHKSDVCTNQQISHEELQEILINDEEYMRKAKNKTCYRCRKVGHYPIIWELITKREQERLAKSGNDPMFRNSLYTNAASAGTVMIDGVPVPQNLGTGMGQAMGTIFTWDQIFNSILKYYRTNQSNFKDN
jgi:hypothetical protein